MKIALIGDPHAKLNNLDDLRKIFCYAREVKEEEGASRIAIVGDLFDDHAVLRQEVIHSYQEALPILGSPEELILLAGNHDGSTPKSIEINAVALTLKGYGVVVDRPRVIDGILFVPFMSDFEEFEKTCCSFSELECLICHEDFIGGSYETGFRIPRGADPRKIPQKCIISGHIHMQQSFVSKGGPWGDSVVNYIGTPRAISAGEANQEKAIVVFDTITKELKRYPTNHLVKDYRKIEITENDDIRINASFFKEGDDVQVVISGSESFYKTVLEANKDLEGLVRFIPNISVDLKKTINIESSDNIPKALYKYVYEIEQIDNHMKDKVWEKLSSLMPKIGKSSSC